MSDFLKFYKIQQYINKSNKKLILRDWVDPFLGGVGYMRILESLFPVKILYGFLRTSYPLGILALDGTLIM